MFAKRRALARPHLPPRSRRLRLEVLEDRTLPSASPLDVVLVNQRVPHAQDIAAATAPGAVAQLFDPQASTTAGLVAQLARISAQHGGAAIGHLALVSHGSQGQLGIGAGDAWSAATLPQHRGDFATMRSLLAPGARIDLYSCDTAAGADGRALVEGLAKLTGATVFASADDVGTAPGADFVWEVRTAADPRPDLLDTHRLAGLGTFKLVGDWAESNDDRDSAFYLGRGGSFSWGGLSIHSSTDEDWFIVRLVNPGNFSSSVSISFTSSQGDLDMAVYDSAADFVGSSTGVSDTEQVSLSGMPAGDYYVHVYGYNGATNSYSIALNDNQSIGADDFLEFNNEAQFGFTLPVSSAGGNFSINGANSNGTSDDDWFYLRLLGTGTAADNFQVSNFTSSNPSADLDVYLYDAGDTTNWIRRAYTLSDPETLDLSGLAPGNYYIRVDPFSVNGTTPYHVSYHLPAQSTSDHFESNNTVATATNLGTLTTQAVHDNLSIDSSSDVDYFKFTLGGTGRDGDYARIDFTHSQGDLDMGLYDSSGTNLLRWSTGVTDQEEIGLSGLNAGTYYVKVYGYNSAVNPNYKLTVSPPPALAADADEPDDSFGSAHDLGTPGSQLVRPDLSIHSDTDVDWYRFHISSPGTATSSVRIDFSHAAGDIDMALYDSADNFIDSSTGVSDSEEVSLDGLAAGTYYVKVYGYAGHTNPNYTLTVNPPQAGVSSDPYEPDNDFSSAANLGQVRGTLAPNSTNHLDQLSISTGDQDWFKFSTVGTGGSGHFVHIDFIHGQGDIDMALYDQSNTFLTSSTSINDFEQISLAGLPAGTYYLKVYGYAGATNPNYQLTIVAPAGSAFSPDRFEANDTTGTATLLRSGTSGTLSGSQTQDDLSIHSASDVDLFKFTTVGTGTQANSVRVQFNNSDGNLDLQLLNSGGQVIATSASTTASSESLSLNGLPAGTYYVKVYGASGATNGYSLTVDAPGSSDPNSNLPPWTVMVYMTASTLDDGAQQDVNALEAAAARANGLVHFVVLYDQSAARTTYPTGNGAQAAWGGAGEAILAPDTNLRSIATSFSPVGGNTSLSQDVDTANPTTLVNFVSWAVQQAPAQHYALMLWDHGGGLYGSNQDDQDNAGSNIMDVGETTQALQTITQTNGIHLDSFGYWACLMGMAELAYIDRGFAPVYSASEEEMWVPFLDAEHIFTGLTANPRAATGATVGTDLVDNTTHKWVGKLVNGQYTQGDTYAVFNEGAAMDALATKLHDFTTAAIAAAGGSSAVLAALRNHRNDAVLFNFGDQTSSNPFPYRDLGQYLSAIQRDTTLPANLRNAAQAAIDAITAARIDKTNDSRECTGLSIYMPAGQIRSDYQNNSGPFASFNQATGWRDFLQLLLTGSATTGAVAGAAALPAAPRASGWEEVHDTQANALNLRALAGPGHAFPALSVSSNVDTDWFRFDTAATGGAADRVRVTATNPGDTLELALVNGSGTALQTVSGTGTQTVSLNGLAAGTWFVRVRTTGTQPVADYTLTVDAPAAAVPPSWIGDNSTQAKATDLGSVTAAQVVPGLSVAAGAQNWFTFDSPVLLQGQGSLLRVLIPGPGTLTAELLDQGGHVVARASGGGVLELYYAQPGAAQTYALHISGGATATQYHLLFTATSAFADSFNRPNDASPGANYSTVLGGASVAGNALTVAAGQLTVEALQGFTGADVSARADVSVAPGQTAGLGVRYSGPGDSGMYWGGLSNSGNGVSALLYVNVAGTWTFLGAAAAPAAGGTLRLDAVGSSITLYLNGQALVAVRDSSLAGPGKVVFRAVGGTFDNLQAVALGSASVPFNDNFDRPDSTLTGAGWLQASGEASIQGNRLVLTSPAVGVSLVQGAQAGAVAVQADVNLTSGQIAGLVARWSGLGDSNMYTGGIVATATGASAYIYRNVGGAWALLASGTANTAAGTLRFEAVGPMLRLFLGGTLLASAVDSSLTGGLAGVRGTSGVAYDNFSLTALAPQAATLPFNDAFAQANGTPLAPTWTEQAGALRVQGNQLQGAAAGLDIATVNALAADVSVQANVALAAGQTAGLVARYSGPGDTNMYLGGISGTGSGGSAYLYRNVGGVWTLRGIL